MSHVDIIECEINSLLALEKAVGRLGGTFKHNKKTFAWFGYSVGDHPIPKGFKEKDMGKCEHAISFPNSKYEIGVCRDPANSEKHVMLADFWGSGGISRVVGEGGWKLKQALTMEQAAEKAIETGKRYVEETLPDRKRITVYLN